MFIYNYTVDFLGNGWSDRSKIKIDAQRGLLLKVSGIKVVFFIWARLRPFSHARAQKTRKMCMMFPEIWTSHTFKKFLYG